MAFVEPYVFFFFSGGGSQWFWKKLFFSATVEQQLWQTVGLKSRLFDKFDKHMVRLSPVLNMK